MTALRKELSNAELESNKPINTLLVSLLAAVKYHKGIYYSSFTWFLCIHITKVKMAKDNKTDKIRCYREQLNTFQEKN